MRGGINVKSAWGWGMFHIKARVLSFDRLTINVSVSFY